MQERTFRIDFLPLLGGRCAVIAATSSAPQLTPALLPGRGPETFAHAGPHTHAGRAATPQRPARPALTNELPY